MSALRRLTRWDKIPIYVNPAHVIALEPAAQEGRTRVVLALIDNHGCAGLQGLLSETVLGTPSDVAALLLPPLGPAP